MKLKTLQKSARIASKALKIGCYIMGGLSIAMFIMLISFALQSSVRTVKTAVANGVPVSYTDSLITIGIGCFIFICIFFILLYLQRIFRCVGEGTTPFVPDTSRRLRKIGLLILILGFFRGFPGPVDPLAIIDGFIYAFILFCLALVFDYGCELQKEIDETL